MKRSKGFTLIELLVVIAIIGILATIVLVSLNAARDKAKDVAIKAGLDQARLVAEVYYDDNSSSYSGLTNANPSDMLSINTNVSNNNGGTSLTVNPSADGQDYCVASPLASSGYHCVDSSGWNAAVTATTWCDAANGTCAND